MIKALNPGSIEVITGCMYSGKTAELIRRLKRAGFANKTTICFKPLIPGRDDQNSIVSHDKLKYVSLPVASVNDIVGLSGGALVVAIDDAHFFSDELVAACKLLSRFGSQVIVAGLDMDYYGEPYMHMANLMAQSIQLEKLDAVCKVCGIEKAHFTQLLKPELAPLDPRTPLIGGTDLYEARCRACFKPPERKETT